MKNDKIKLQPDEPENPFKETERAGYARIAGRSESVSGNRSRSCSDTERSVSGAARTDSRISAGCCILEIYQPFFLGKAFHLTTIHRFSESIENKSQNQTEVNYKKL